MRVCSCVCAYACAARASTEYECARLRRAAGALRAQSCVRARMWVHVEEPVRVRQSMRNVHTDVRVCMRMRMRLYMRMRMRVPIRVSLYVFLCSVSA